MTVCGYIRIYLAVYGPEIIGGYGLDEKKNESSLMSRNTGRTNYNSLRNVRPPTIDPHAMLP